VHGSAHGDLPLTEAATPATATLRIVPWLVAVAFFMESFDLSMRWRSDDGRAHLKIELQMTEIEDTTTPVAMAPGTAGNAAIRIASLPPHPGPTLGELTGIIQETIDTTIVEAEKHRQKLVALIRAILARPEMFAKEPSARASVERFLEESEARFGAVEAGTAASKTE
jgi:hypothetical protein